jgi:hypothetical protein
MAPENIEVPTELNQFKDSIVNLRFKGFYNEKIRLKEVIKSKVEEYPDDMRKGFEEYKKVLKFSCIIWIVLNRV